MDNYKTAQVTII